MLANEESKDNKDVPKSKQMVKMLTFRVVPAYFNEIEKVASKKKLDVSTLIRSYIKDGMKRDKSISSSEESNFKDTNMF